MRSYGSIALRPDAGASSPDPSTGAHCTSEIVTASRLLRASDSLAAMCISPTIRHSSVRPSKGTRRRPDSPTAASGAPGSAPSFLRLRKSNGTSVLARAGIRPDEVHDAGIGEGRRIAEGAALGDVAQQPAHDLARAGLGQIRHEHQALGLGDRADLGRNVLAQLVTELGRGLVAQA